MIKTPERGLLTETMKKRLVRLEGGIVDTAEAYSKVKKALCENTNATLSEVLKTVDQLKSRLAQVERERDAAVMDIETAINSKAGLGCHLCKHNGVCDRFECVWEWRGVCDENTEEG